MSTLRIFICTLLLIVLACGDNGASGINEGVCQLDATAPPDYAQQLPCKSDFEALGENPLDATLPSATSVKVVLDRVDGNTLYFQNTQKFQIHYQFCAAHLSGNGRPVVPALGSFNSTEYFSPDRRFVLGAVTYYALADKWVLELSPYDTADAEMIALLHAQIKAVSYFGPALAFHPTSEALAVTALTLPASVPVISTDELYAGINYQPLSTGAAIGRLRFVTVAELNSGAYLSYQDIAVMDSAPNDIGPVQGTVTADFQTPLSHINVLAHNRKTPNMGLRGAMSNPDLLAYKDQLVRLTVTSNAWAVEAVTQAEAEAFWASHAPSPVTLPVPDYAVTALANVADITPNPTGNQTLKGNIQNAMRAYGGKTASYAVLYNTPGLPVRKAFGIPAHYYDAFMRTHGFYDRVDAMLADPRFRTDAATRDAMLTQLRADMIAAPVDSTFANLLAAKVATEFPGVAKMKFRSSSNSEDLNGFPCAGCYDSFGGKTNDLNDMLTAIKSTWASVWSFRGFELRSYYQVPQKGVAMCILAHASFVDEAANGVAVTANPFDATGLDPAFYVNVQLGEDAEVVSPPPGVTSDQFLYYFTQPNQPISFLAHSNLVPAGSTVLSTTQTFELGTMMNKVHERFSEVYGPASGNNGWYGMDIEFKFDNSADPSKPPSCWIKQARPYPSPLTP